MSASIDDVLSGRARWCAIHADHRTVTPSMPDGCVSAVIDDVPYGVKTAEWDKEVPPQSWLDESLRVSRGPVVWFGSATKVFDFAAYTPKPDRILVWTPRFTLSHTAAHGVFYRWQPIYVWRHCKVHGGIEWDVLDHPTEGHHDWNHPDTKPISLMADLVDAYCEPGGVVLDMTAGSGTTGVGALGVGRRAILIEQDPVHVQTIVNRCTLADTGVDWRNTGQQKLDLDLGKPTRTRRRKA